MLRGRSTVRVLQLLECSEGVGVGGGEERGEDVWWDRAELSVGRSSWHGRQRRQCGEGVMGGVTRRRSLDAGVARVGVLVPFRR
jgi:hypothetical protein